MVIWSNGVITLTVADTDILTETNDKYTKFNGNMCCYQYEHLYNSIEPNAISLGLGLGHCQYDYH